MDAFVWDHHFVTGIGSIDRQHQTLVDLINAFGEAVVSHRAEQDCYQRTLNELVDYTREHFGEEERLMQEVRVDPSHVRLHVRQHGQFFQHVDSLLGDQQDPGAPRRLLDFLCHWLASHILGIDKSLARQISAIRSGLSPADAYLTEQSFHDTQTAPLLQALGNLFDQLMERNRQLSQLNQQLEAKVAARTKDLDAANRHLQALALTDPLTGIPNRRCGIQLLESSWQSRPDTPLSCLLIDADNFKSVNDRHGHEAGDAVLRQLASAMRHELRTDDHLCRLGGDEFLVICPDTDQFGALHLAEKVRCALSGLTIPFANGRWVASVSIGVAQRQGNMGHYECLIRLADRGVYAAKAAGRNNVRAA